jgi:hypothetical protein
MDYHVTASLDSIAGITRIIVGTSFGKQVNNDNAKSTGAISTAADVQKAVNYANKDTKMVLGAFLYKK